MRIGIVGGGTVGRATARSFIEHVDEVRVFDVVKERRTHSLPDTLGCDLVFVCLPTPQKEGSFECDTRFLDQFFSDHAGYSTNFVLRSTVPIGYTKGTAERYSPPNLVHSPEFLTARCAMTDAQIPSRNIIGYVDPSSNCALLLAELYHRRFRPVRTFCMSSNESEAVKLVLNSFFAVKVSFFNEAYRLAQAAGCDWRRVIDGVLSDGRIAHSHTNVPGPDGKFGFGGECLPKDLASFIACSEANGLHSRVSEASLYRNLEDRNRE